jgi:hypothetical protein
MNLILVKQNSPEWEYMWNWLANHPLNQQLENPSLALNEGEAWQYMGSYKQIDATIHTFRHKNHPSVGYKTLNVAASESFTQDQIETSYKL